jgi:hypothetical protein
VALQDRARAIEVTGQHRPERLGVEMLAERRGADEVAEEDADRLPLLAQQAELALRAPLLPSLGESSHASAGRMGRSAQTRTAFQPHGAWPSS